MKLANRIQTILCDDVRNETRNKFSLMGVYTQNVVFQKLPAILPKLCFCVMMQGVSTDFQKCQVTLKSPETEPVHLKLELSKDSHIGKDINLFELLLRILWALTKGPFGQL